MREDAWMPAMFTIVSATTMTNAQMALECAPKGTKVLK
jgi:hypothetical protein